MISNRIQLFISAMAQVSLVAMNMVFLTANQVIMIAITGFLISLIWTFNVKKIAFGNWVDRITYASGACAGTVTGYYIATYITHI